METTLLKNQTLMTSENLQQRFKNQYEMFFSKHSLVFSGTNVMSWSPTLGYSNSLVRIKQKIPTKTFIGLEFNGGDELILDSVNNYNIVSDSFESFFYSQINPFHHKVQRFLTSYLKGKGIKKGVTIRFLSENPAGHGFGFIGISSMLISFAIHKLTGEIQERDIENYDQFMKSEMFDKVHGFAWQIEMFCRSGKAYGSNAYVSMCNSNLPLVYMFEQFDKSSYLENESKENVHIENENGESSLVGSNDLSEYFRSDIGFSKDDYIKKYNYSLGSLFKYKNLLQEIPLDYGVIYLGTENDMSQNEYLFGSYKSRYEELKKFILGNLDENGIDDASKLNIGGLLQKDFYSNFENIGSLLSMKILYCFNQLLSKGYDEALVDEFIRSVKDSGKFVSMLEDGQKIISKIMFLFKQNKQFSDEEMGIVPINSGKIGGSCIFVTKMNKSRNTIQKVFDELKKLGYDNVRLEYCSWRDGTCNDGVILEQSIKDNKLSNYLDDQAVIVKRLDGGHTLTKYSKAIENTKAKLVLDKINRKVLVNGKKVTSRELKSQTTTIDLLDLLIRNYEDEVKGNMLPISSYSKNKNELVGKVIVPLQKLLQAEFGVQLPIVCHGSLIDFFIKLGKTDFDIVVIEKLFDGPAMV